MKKERRSPPHSPTFPQSNNADEVSYFGNCKDTFIPQYEKEELSKSYSCKRVTDAPYFKKEVESQKVGDDATVPASDAKVQGSTHTFAVSATPVIQKWCLQDMQDIYDWDIEVTYQGRPRWSIIEEPQIKTIYLARTTNIKATFDRYRLGWMCPKLIRQLCFICCFYIFDYTSRVESSGLASIIHTLVRGTLIDLSQQIIQRFLFRPGYLILKTVVEFDYRMKTVRSQIKMKDLEQ